MKIRPYSRIVVEGMDGSGKTTLVNQLMNYLGEQGHYVPGYNRVEGEKSPMPRWWMEQLAVNPVGKVVIHDRFFYPELVYGPILRNKLNMDPTTRNYVQNFLRTHAFLVYCRPPISIIEQGIRAEKQMDGVESHFNDLLIKYDQVMLQEAPEFKGRFFKYDRSNDNSLMQFLQLIAGYIYE